MGIVGNDESVGGEADQGGRNLTSATYNLGNKQFPCAGKPVLATESLTDF